MTTTKTGSKITMEKCIAELHKAFDLLNKTYYNNELPTPMITVYPTAKQNAFGWFTPAKLWTDENKETQLHEIALSAEYMNRSYIDVIGTLHHEMIHLYCHINGIKDTSRNGKYHNKNFKEESEKRGFVYDYDTPDKRHGWSFNKKSEELIETIKSFNLDEDAFKVARAIEKQNKRPQRRFSYECGCGTRIRGKAGLNITCNDCGMDFKMIQ